MNEYQGYQNLEIVIFLPFNGVLRKSTYCGPSRWFSNRVREGELCLLLRLYIFSVILEF